MRHDWRMSDVVCFAVPVATETLVCVANFEFLEHWVLHLVICSESIWFDFSCSIYSKGHRCYGLGAQFSIYFMIFFFV